ncbi:MAG: sulfatase-like hydrolase/transferase, partial [Armatimonadetes bacterium]|nr:sulfatase-like hydrolase/transferase [Armatimonadota bacterium]
LDRLAAEGVNCPRAWSTTPICHPARASLITGLYPYAHGMLTNGTFAGGWPFTVRAEVPVLPELLRNAGYRTGYAGQCHIEISGWDDHRNQWTRDYLSWLREQGYPQESPPPEAARWLCGTVPYGPELTREAQFCRRGLELLDDLCGQSQPWFMQLDFDGPHPPCWLPESHAGRYDPTSLPLPETLRSDLADRPEWVRLARRRQGSAERSDADWQRYNAYYHGQVTMIDELLGRVLERLDQHGQADNTLVVFTSDHATPVGYHGFAVHGGPTLYEAVLRVPLVVRWPAGLPAGCPSEAAIEHVDLVPTLLEAAGADPVPSHGESALGALRGESSDCADQSYHVYNGTGTLFFSVRAYQQEGWKLIYTPVAEPELYHTATDPYESCNLAGQPETAATEQRLRRALLAEMERVDDPLRRYCRSDLER